MSQADDNVKGDKIKALALAKECYAMKLELLRMRKLVLEMTFKGSEEDRVKQWSPTTRITTNNSIF